MLNTFYFPRPGINLGLFLKQKCLKDFMSIKSVILQYPLRDKYALDLLAGYKLDNLILIRDFDKILKFVIPYLEGLRV